MELMGIRSSRVNGTSRNRLYGCLGLRRFTGKESKDHSARRDDKQREKMKEQDKEVHEAWYLFVHHALSHRVFKNTSSSQSTPSISNQREDASSVPFAIPFQLNSYR
jgi:hypothetical protein